MSSSLQKIKKIYYVYNSTEPCKGVYAGTLKDVGFELNPYNPFVANKQINGSQSTICWYVDDNKMSHKDSKVVDGIIKN